MKNIFKRKGWDIRPEVRKKDGFNKNTSCKENSEIKTDETEWKTKTMQTEEICESLSSPAVCDETSSYGSYRSGQTFGKAVQNEKNAVYHKIQESGICGAWLKSWYMINRKVVTWYILWTPWLRSQRRARLPFTTQKVTSPEEEKNWFIRALRA